VGFLDLVRHTLNLVVGEPGERWIASQETRDFDEPKYESLSWAWRAKALGTKGAIFNRGRNLNLNSLCL
jgi:hypothetical protein